MKSDDTIRSAYATVYSRKCTGGPNRSEQRRQGKPQLGLDRRSGSENIAKLNTLRRHAFRRRRLAFRTGHISQRAAGPSLNELSRYRDKAIVLSSTRLGQRRLSGVLNIDNPESFLDALPYILPVAIQRRQDGSVVVTAKLTNDLFACAS